MKSLKSGGLMAGDPLSDARFSDDEFLSMRKDVLAAWPTGAELSDLDQNLAYLRALPRHKVFPHALADAKRDKRIMIVPQIGHATPEEMVEQLRHVEKAGADSFFVQCDAYTRKLLLHNAEDGIRESYRTGISALNGFPFINHGLVNSKKLIEAVDIPLYVNGDNDEDGRLLTEMAFAAGFTNSVICGLRDSITHEKDFPADRRIRNAQYICRLAAHYTERGVPIELTIGGSGIGCVGGTPGMGLAIGVLEAVSAAAQGAKHLSLVQDTQGNLVQDVASLRVHRQLAERYLRRFGLNDVVVSMLVYPWTGAWPRNELAAGLLMGWFGAIGALGHADWVKTKSTKEAFGIPSAESNAASVGLTRYAIDLMGAQAIPLGAGYEEECAMLEAEAVAIIDASLDLGGGDAAVGRLRALEAGVIDVPYPSYEFTRRLVLSGRDAHRAVRWVDTGNVPLPAEVVAYHRAKLATGQGQAGDLSQVEKMLDDIMALARLPVGRPG